MHLVEKNHPSHPDPALLCLACYPDHLQLVTQFVFTLLDHAPELLLRRAGWRGKIAGALSLDILAHYAAASIFAPLYCRDLPDPALAPEICRIVGVRLLEPNTIKALRCFDRIGLMKDGIPESERYRREVDDINRAFFPAAKVLLSFTQAPDGLCLFSSLKGSPRVDPVKLVAHILTHWPEMSDLGNFGLLYAVLGADRFAVLLDCLIYNQSGCADSRAIHEVLAGVRGVEAAEPVLLARWQQAMPQLLKDLNREFLLVTDTGANCNLAVESAATRVLMRALRERKLLTYHIHQPPHLRFGHE
ncbi:MAG: hypothetical protein PHE83_18175 [Opitutaceae bacterium]|nr:hypothetical protein [Opitutaceae bacterium]